MKSEREIYLSSNDDYANGYIERGQGSLSILPTPSNPLTPSSNTFVSKRAASSNPKTSSS
ncbi:MAG: hypothetical protein AB7T10_09530 [bacterium]